MKAWKLCALALVLHSASASADSIGGLDAPHFFNQMAYSALHVADWQQTRRIAARPDLWRETNPLLGEHPSQARVNRYFAVTLGMHWAITYALPKEWREPWQHATIALEVSVVRRNLRLGISARF